MEKKHSVRSLVTTLFLFGLIFFGVVDGWAEEQSEPMADEIIFNRLAVTPFLVGQRQPNMDETLDYTLSCPINQICGDDPSIQSNAGPMMMRLVHTALKWLSADELAHHGVKEIFRPFPDSIHPGPLAEGEAGRVQ